jgi:1-acyl-sn-glycerol-3-phosphate acyltransferase
MNRDYRAYRRLYHFLTATLSLFYRYDVVGRENIPDGPAVLCANHSSNFDPIMISLAAGIDRHIHYMAKKELFRVPIVSSVIKAIGSYPVDRGNKDIGAIKMSLKYLKAGEKIGIFPEGTRTKTAGEKAAKSGAIRLADQANVPIVPVWLPRRKRPFKKIRVVFHKPYFVNPEHRSLSREDYETLAEELMDKINATETAEPGAAS